MRETDISPKVKTQIFERHDHKASMNFDLIVDTDKPPLNRDIYPYLPNTQSPFSPSVALKKRIFRCVNFDRGRSGDYEAICSWDVKNLSW